MIFLRNLVIAFALLVAGISSADAANRFAVCTTTCTWDGASTAMWSSSSGGATGASVPGSADAVILDAATCVGGTTCTITVNTNPTITSITMGACTASTTGCILDFSANNNNVTLNGTGMALSGTGTRNLKMGNGTWTFSSNGNVTAWNALTTTNLTFAANSSTMVFSGALIAQEQTEWGGLTYNAVQFADTGTGRGAFLSTGNGTFASIALTAPMRWVITGGTTLTITTAFTWAGTTSSNTLLIEDNEGQFNNVATISVATGSPSISWATLRSITFTGGATFTATNSFNAGGVSGITVTGPSGGGSRCIGC